MVIESNWPVAVLASAFGPRRDPGRLNMAICVGYFEPAESDVSGTVTVAGFVAEKPRWQSFEERWPRTLRNEGLTAFSGRDFVRAAGAFANGWTGNVTRRSRLVAALGRIVDRHVTLGVSCSLKLADYETAVRAARDGNDRSDPPTAASLCAGVAMVRVLQWTARNRPQAVTLFAFEDGDVEGRDARRVAAADGAAHGEPVQIWPRTWLDEHGRLRQLRPFEACDLLLSNTGSDIAVRLADRGAWEHERLDTGRVSDLLTRLSRQPSRTAVVPGRP
jgi:hypothetical protein